MRTDGRGRTRRWNKRGDGGRGIDTKLRSRNLFKSRPWEKQANNQSNCKMEFPAGRKGRHYSNLWSHLSPPRPSSRIRRLRSEVVKGRGGNFCASIIVYPSERILSARTLIMFPRDWRIFVALRRTWRFSPHGQQITSPFSLTSPLRCPADTNFAICRGRAKNRRNNIFFHRSTPHDLSLSRHLPYRGHVRKRMSLVTSRSSYRNRSA